MIGLNLKRVEIVARVADSEDARRGRSWYGAKVLEKTHEVMPEAADFIAAASPAVVLEMIQELRRRRTTLVSIAEGRHDVRCETGGRGDGPCRCAARQATELLDLTGDFGRLNEGTPIVEPR